MAGKPCLYRLIDHTADLGMEVCGRDLRDLFSRAGNAMVDMMTDRSTAFPRNERILKATGTDWTDLLIAFLRELLALHTIEDFLPVECSVDTIAPYRLTALVRGEPCDPSRHRIIREIKAVTYHGAVVEKTGRRWRGRVIFDV
ncbi:MAG: archease [Deltaproteobacteria bacterium]|nr:archease [Deltaproteobacteria bacterium]